MALLEGSLYAESLGMNTGITASIPGERRDETGDMPVLYLLHGLSDDHTSWVRRTDIDRYAEEWGVAVIMPEVQRSFYCDMAYGLRYFTYIADELPRLCQRLFRVSARREDSFVAGLSMGGYGAIKAALARPERFAAAASFSGAVDVAARVASHPDIFLAACGGTLRAQDDLFQLAEQTPVEKRPRLYMSCGDEDFLLEDNRRFSAHLDALGWEHPLEIWPGTHDYHFWDESVRRALAFFFEGR